MEKFFEVKNLCYSYIKKPLCLKDVSFSADKKDRILILATKDMGKTTLIKTLSGFDDKFFGEVKINGKSIKTIADNEKNISILFNKPILINGTIKKNLEFLYKNINKEIPSDDELVNLLDKFEINYELKKNICKLSVFEKFKLCLIRVYIKNPEIIFIDDIFDNDFSKEETNKLINLINMVSQDKLLFISASENSFLKQKSVFETLSFSKILYLNNALIYENKSIAEFYKNYIDLTQCLFDDNLKYFYGYCIFQDNAYFLNIDEKFILKIDKIFFEKFDKLKLSANENEDIVVVIKNDINVDFSKNNDIMKMMKNGNIMIFSKIDGCRVI